MHAQQNHGQVHLVCHDKNCFEFLQKINSKAKNTWSKSGNRRRSKSGFCRKPESGENQMLKAKIERYTENKVNKTWSKIKYCETHGPSSTLSSFSSLARLLKKPETSGGLAITSGQYHDWFRELPGGPGGIRWAYSINVFSAFWTQPSNHDSNSQENPEIQNRRRSKPTPVPGLNMSAQRYCTWLNPAWRCGHWHIAMKLSTWCEITVGDGRSINHVSENSMICNFRIL